VSVAASLSFLVLFASMPSYKTAPDYVAWYATLCTYSLAFDLGLLASTILTIALLVAYSPRLALALTFFSINLLFAWTSHLLGMISQPLAYWVSWMSTPQNTAVWYGLYFAGITAYLHTFAGLEGLALVGLLVGLVFKLSRDRGVRRALLASLQAVALCLMILGAEIALFDRSELYLHATSLQVFVDFVPWLSNADLFIIGAAVLGASALASGLHRLRRLG